MAGEGFFPFSSETSLGWTRSGASTIAQSYGTTTLSGLSVIGTSLATQFLGPSGTNVFPTFGFSTETRLGLFRSQASTVEITFGQFVVNSGSQVRPGIATNSERSLGIWRSGVSTLGLSYGTLNLATGAVNLSMATLAAATSAVDSGLAIVFRSSGLSLVYKSGGTIYVLAASTTSGTA